MSARRRSAAGFGCALFALLSFLGAHRLAGDRISPPAPSPPTEPSGERSTAEPAGLIAAVGGSAERCAVSDPGGSGSSGCSALERLAWIAPGDRLVLDRGALVNLLLLDGRRFELRGPLTAEVRASAVEIVDLPRRSPLSGPAIREQAPAPELDLAPLAAAERPARELGAVRLRPGAIEGLTPDRGVVPPESATLAFRPVANAPRYRVIVLDGVGRMIHDVETDASEVALPADLLRAGESYLWQVATVGRPGATLRGEAEFRTLDVRAAKLRSALRAAHETSTPEALLLLAEVDRRLGLAVEARSAADRLSASAAGDEPLRRAIAGLVERPGIAPPR
jgi:hypothetical protein